jgi:hypothetical protein
MLSKFPEHLDTLVQLVNATKRCGSEGKPLYLSNPEQSTIRVMSEAAFERHSAPQIQAIFKERHIVVTDNAFQPTKFDLHALRKIGRESQPLSVNGTRDLQILKYFDLLLTIFRRPVRSCQA